jgi:heme A synthase
MGAVTALGDTLFKADSTAVVLGQALDSGAHPLERLRVYHPLLAVLLVGWTFVAVPRLIAAFPGVWSRRWGNAVVALGFVQLAIGVANIWLKAPVWMQLTHLLLADAFWIALVLLASEALAHPARTAAPVRRTDLAPV